MSATTVVAPIFPKCCFKFTPSLTASSGGDFSGVVVQGSLFQPERTVRIELYDQKTGVPLNYTYLPSNNTGSFTWDDVPDFHLYCNENLEVRAYDTVTARWIYTTGTAGCKSANQHFPTAGRRGPRPAAGGRACRDKQAPASSPFAGTPRPKAGLPCART